MGGYVYYNSIGVWKSVHKDWKIWKAVLCKTHISGIPVDKASKSTSLKGGGGLKTFQSAEYYEKKLFALTLYAL